MRKSHQNQLVAAEEEEEGEEVAVEVHRPRVLVLVQAHLPGYFWMAQSESVSRHRVHRDCFGYSKSSLSDSAFQDRRPEI
jgi:hypothetical protein